MDISEQRWISRLDSGRFGDCVWKSFSSSACSKLVCCQELNEGNWSKTVLLNICT